MKIVVESGTQGLREKEDWAVGQVANLPYMQPSVFGV
jgi:hypothetical protein